MGDTAEAGARPTGPEGSSSGVGGPPTPTVEELARENASLKQSVQGLARERDEWKVKASQPAGTDDRAAEEWLTPTTARSVIREELTALQQEQTRTYEAQMATERERQRWNAKAMHEVPDAKDPTSPVYKKALELFNDPQEGLSRQVNGQALAAYPNAEYIAFLRANALVGTAAQGTAEHRAGAAFAAEGGPSGGGAGAGSSGDLSDEAYLKLSPEERATYQDRKFLEKHGQAP